MIELTADRSSGSPQRLFRSLRALAWLITLIATSACAPLARFDAAGALAGAQVTTRVDSREAVYYLEQFLPGQVGGSEVAARVDLALSEHGREPTDRVQLEALADTLSPDAAMLHLVASLYDEPDNRRLQDDFQGFVGALTSSPQSEIIATLAPYTRYRVVFIPGYAYRSNPVNGADFGRQRTLLRELGFEPTLVETEELGLVDVNAKIVAAAIRAEAAEHDNLILVSASKGGAEVAAALSELGDEPAVGRVKAWISVGGLLRGSPYADRYLRGIKRWFANFMLRRRGQPPEILEDLSTVVRRPAFDALSLPSSVLMLHYVGAPLSGQVPDETRGRYRLLRRLGPNDGLTLLADELTENGLVVTEVGLDHYFRAEDIDLRTVALMYAVFTELDRREQFRVGRRTSRCAPGVHDRAACSGLTTTRVVVR